MTVVRYTPGSLRAVVAPHAIAVLGEPATDATAEAVWEQLHRGAGLAGVVDALAAGGPLSALPPFAVALDEDGGWRIAVRGDLTVSLGTDAAAERVDGAGVSTWIERSIRSADTLVIGPAAPVAAALPLRDGVVAAASVLIAREENASPAPAAQPAAAPAGPRRSGAPVEPVQPHSVAEVRQEADAPSVPEPPAAPAVADAPAASAAPDASPTHPTPAAPEVPAPAAAVPTPAAPAPATAPAPEVPAAPAAAVPPLDEDIEATIIRGPGEAEGESEDATITLEEARRLRAAGELPPVAPPLSPPVPSAAAGLLRVSSGQSVLLERTVIIGRRPRSTRISGADLPHLIAVDSPQQDISRNHLEVRVEGDSILATDLNTTNGTRLLRRGAEPVRLHPGEQTIVVPGDVLDLGDGITVAVEDVP
ncbi:FHA domain-containing protein [Microbacterium sp. dk485]|uniref:FHA domain-containing protein n=1 Tax=Microbacterium sp. dk485 TaxID=2560021 RepID=UPI0010746D0C|nr:FHA domain-containing protein [Microbacterium sp. dk485]TFV84509.1 FHA domain-containing protein [Microbacterium sp. dk485]